MKKQMTETGKLTMAQEETIADGTSENLTYMQSPMTQDGKYQ